MRNPTFPRCISKLCNTRCQRLCNLYYYYLPNA